MGIYDSGEKGLRNVFLELLPPTSPPSSGSRPRLLGPAGTAHSPGDPWRQLRAEAACSPGWQPRCPCPRPRPDRPGCPDARGGRRSAAECRPPARGSWRTPLPAVPSAGRTVDLPAPACRAASGPGTPPWPPGPGELSEPQPCTSLSGPRARGQSRASLRGVVSVPANNSPPERAL